MIGWTEGDGWVTATIDGVVHRARASSVAAARAELVAGVLDDLDRGRLTLSSEDVRDLAQRATGATRPRSRAVAEDALRALAQGVP